MKKRTKTFNIIDAINDKDVFGSLPAFSRLDTWASWLTWLKSVFAIPMTADELAIYQKCTGREAPPAKPPAEIFTVVGRRGGKSFISSLTACFIACFSNFKRYLNAGERAAILILARDRDQAKIVFNYVSGILHAVPPLEAMIAVERADEIELDNGVVIMVKTSDFRAIRGLTVAAAILDEVAFWDSEGVSPDREVLTALRPATSTIPSAKLTAISTPYSQAGSLYEAHRDFFGVDNDDVLVWQADTRTMNPTIDEGLIQREIERDPDGAQAEWMATFRTDLQAAFSPESLEACVIKGRSELPASQVIAYSAFVDPSGGKADSFTLSIGHRGEDRVIIDFCREWQAPFNPKEVTGRVAEVLKAYGCVSVVGDRFAAEWPVAEFREHGIAYKQCEQNKSELYLAFVPVTNSHGVELPDDKRLLTQLRRLERKRGRAGKDTIDHPPRLHDDLANSVAGVCHVLNTKASNQQSTFNPLLHVAPKSLRLVPGNWPIFIGLSSGDGIVATVIAQTYNEEIRIFAAFLSEQTSTQGHLLESTKPWLSANAGSLRLTGAYEDSPNVEIRSALYSEAKKTLGGEWLSISTPWENRRDLLLTTLTKAVPFKFSPVLQIDPTATLLSRALVLPYDKGRTETRKNYHLVNALTLLLSRQELWKATPRNPKPRILPPSWMSA
jgi:hypothetical protein